MMNIIHATPNSSMNSSNVLVQEFQEDNYIRYGLKKLFWQFDQDVHDKLVDKMVDYLRESPCAAMANQNADDQRSHLSFELIDMVVDLRPKPQIAPTEPILPHLSIEPMLPSSNDVIINKPSWTRLFMLFSTVLFVIIVLAFAIKRLVSLYRRRFREPRARDALGRNSNNIIDVDEAVETIEQSRPHQPPLDITRSPNNNEEVDDAGYTIRQSHLHSPPLKASRSPDNIEEANEAVETIEQSRPHQPPPDIARSPKNNEEVDEAVDTVRQSHPLEPPQEVAPSDLHTTHNPALLVTMPEPSGGSELTAAPKEVAGFDSAEQVAPSLEPIVEEMVYEWNLADFVENVTALMEFSVYPLQSTPNSFDGKLDFIRGNKTNLEMLAAAMAYVREIQTRVKQGIELMSSRPILPATKSFSEMWKPLEEVEAAFVHDCDLKQLMDHIEHIDKAHAEAGYKKRKTNHEIRPKVQYVFRCITNILKEKQANMERFLLNARGIHDRYENGRLWDIAEKIYRESPKDSSMNFPHSLESSNIMEK